MTDTLELEQREGTGIYTRMERIVVDGIVDVRPYLRGHHPIFSFKDEFDSDDMPEDTGGLKFHWNPNIEISEDHWLSCQSITVIGESCIMCGRHTIK